MTSYVIKEELELQKRLFDKNSNEIDNLKIAVDPKSRCIYGCYNLAIEHHASVLYLVEARYWGTAFALLRIVREAYIRGAYLHYCASESCWENFNNGKSPEAMNKMTEEVASFLKQPDLFKKQDYSFLNDLTHTGIEHIRHRVMRNQDATPNYPEKEKFQLLKNSGGIAELAFAGIRELI